MKFANMVALYFFQSYYIELAALFSLYNSDTSCVSWHILIEWMQTYIGYELVTMMLYFIVIIMTQFHA
jgi:hypothetical protein